jgi:hypothetical protein
MIAERSGPSKMSSSSSSATKEVSDPVETFETTVKRSSSVCLNTLAETKISSDVLPNETPRLLKLDEIRESEKEIKDLEGSFIPVVSRFFSVRTWEMGMV